MSRSDENEARPSIEYITGVPDDELSTRWREESLQYVSAINAYVEQGETEGWENAGDEPEDTRQPLAKAVLDVVRCANAEGDLDTLRERFPPAHSPFFEMLEENGESLPVVMFLDDGRILLRIGSPYQNGRVVIIDDTKVVDTSPEIITVGRSPNRRYFAVARKSGVTMHDGWEGPVVAEFQWPTGLEDIPAGFEISGIEQPPTITQLIPFPQGNRALLVTPDGIFVLTSQRAFRLLPTKDEMQEHFEWLQKEYPDDELSYDLSMEHGAVSPDGRYIAAGHQSSLHYVFESETYKGVGEIGNLSEYPHYALFSSDGEMIAFNSCHFYNGMTIGVPTQLLPGLQTEPYEEDKRLPLLQEGARVYAGVSRNDEFIIVDASGYVRAFDKQGNRRWQHFVGSSGGDMDVSPDGKQLVVTTYAGFLSIIDLDTGQPDPFTIGTSQHRERRRWLFWKQEPKPLIW